jgi:hypothetical protein
MKTKKELSEFDLNAYFSLFNQLIGDDKFLFGGMSKQKYDENDLGNGMRLVSIFELMPELLKNEEMMKELGSTKDYSFLFKEGVKVSDKVFRKGGISNGFQKGGYASLIVYHNFFDRTVKTRYGRTHASHCIVDLDGKIVLEEQGFSKYPYYLKGIIGAIDKAYYNLRTSELIIMGDSCVESEEYLFVQEKYDFEWYGGKEKPKGVYKICFETGEVEYFK